MKQLQKEVGSEFKTADAPAVQTVAPKIKGEAKTKAQRYTRQCKSWTSTINLTIRCTRSRWRISTPLSSRPPCPNVPQQMNDVMQGASERPQVVATS